VPQVPPVGLSTAPGLGQLLRSPESGSAEPSPSVPEPPGPIDNSRIVQVRGSGHIQLKQGEFQALAPAIRLIQAVLSSSTCTLLPCPNPSRTPLPCVSDLS
jgi:hypothetical protein